MSATELTESYKRYHGDDRFDAIVVGSGLGGLAVASLLAREKSWRVAVLERHYTAGGFTHTFKRPGYEWDVGVHYLGELGDPRRSMRRMFDGISAAPIEWADLGEVYDRVFLGGRRYDYVKGREAWRDAMCAHFPNETRAIDRYLDLVREVARAANTYYAARIVPRAVATLFGGWMGRAFMKHAARTTRSVLEELTRDQELIAVLTAQWGDYGLPPAESSFAMHATVTRHYFRGAYYPVGGASRIAEAVIPTITRRGGRVLVNAEVAKVVLEGGRAAGVRMADGRVFRAPVIVSDAGFHATTRTLLPDDAPGRAGLLRAAKSVAPSLSHVALYLGFKHTDAALGLSRPNLWIYPSNDYEGDLRRYERDPEAPVPLVYVSFPSAKDPSWPSRYPGRATIDVISGAPYAWFTKWEGTRWRKRGEDYEAFKARLTERLLEVLFRHVPEAKGKVDVAELSTPLSTRHFAGYAEGETYGLSHGPERFRERALQPRTPVPGLFLTGQDVCTCGVGGALAGGYFAASVITGKVLVPIGT